MPLYEYFCSDCQAKFEVLTNYTASREAMVCATCHGTQVHKLFPMVARTSRNGAGDDFGDYASDYGSDADYASDGRGCSCGGACSCQN